MSVEDKPRGATVDRRDVEIKEKAPLVAEAISAAGERLKGISTAAFAGAVPEVLAEIDAACAELRRLHKLPSKIVLADSGEEPAVPTKPRK